MSKLDFQRIFEQGSGKNLVLSTGDYTIIGVSEAYLTATMTTREGILGRCLFDAFPDDVNDPNANGTKILRNSLSAVEKTKSPQKMPLQRYPIPKPEALGGGFEERWWDVTNVPIFDDQGEMIAINHHVEDITKQVTAENVSERLRSTIENITDAFFLLDKDWHTVFMNEHAEFFLQNHWSA